MNEQKFLKCEKCGSILSLLNLSGKAPACCSVELKELTPNTTEAAVEKHLPVATVSGDVVTVKVGSIEHPMLEEHHIEFIYLQTKKGGQVKYLKPGEVPAAVFKVVDDCVIAVFEYCNLHGLWKTELSADIQDDMVCSAEFTDGCM